MSKVTIIAIPRVLREVMRYGRSYPARPILVFALLAMDGCKIGPSSRAADDFQQLCATDPGGTHINRTIHDVEGMIIETRFKWVDLDGNRPVSEGIKTRPVMFERSGSLQFDDPFLTGSSYKFVEFAKNEDEIRAGEVRYNTIPDNGLYRILLDRKAGGECRAFEFSTEEFMKRAGNACAVASKIDHFDARYKVTFMTTTYYRPSNPEESVEKLERIVTDVRTGDIIASASFLSLGWVDLLPNQIVTNVMFYQDKGSSRERRCPAMAPLDIRTVLVPQGVGSR